MKKPGITLETQLSIVRVAVGIHSKQQGVRIAEFEPARGTMVHDGWRSFRLSERRQKAWKAVERLFEEAKGSSPKGCLSPATGQRRGNGVALQPRPSDNWAQEALERIAKQHLHHHERQLFEILVIEFVHSGRLMDLEELGQRVSGYKHGDQARSAGVSRIQALLDSMAEFFGI